MTLTDEKTNQEVPTADDSKVVQPPTHVSILKFIARLIALPFMMIVWSISRIRDGILFSLAWVFLGGEVLAYDKAINPKTIYNELERLRERGTDGGVSTGSSGESKTPSELAQAKADRQERERIPKR